ncbi:hypothetical protein ACFLWY_04885 [Chloroflexota bacterium]
MASDTPQRVDKYGNHLNCTDSHQIKEGLDFQGSGSIIYRFFHLLNLRLAPLPDLAPHGRHFLFTNINIKEITEFTD